MSENKRNEIIYTCKIVKIDKWENKFGNRINI